MTAVGHAMAPAVDGASDGPGVSRPLSGSTALVGYSGAVKKSAR